MTSWFEQENHSRQLPKSAEWTFYIRESSTDVHSLKIYLQLLVRGLKVFDSVG
jgi:hypothetical protein